MLKIVKQAHKNLKKVAIVSENRSFTYQELIVQSENFAGLLLNKQTDLNETSVAFMVLPGFDYVRVQWGIWQAGGITVPLCLSYPIPSLRYTIENSEAKVLVVSPEFVELLQPLATEKSLRLIVLGKDDLLENKEEILLPVFDESRRAMILYTSGTTNLPKGVVTSHRGLNAQISSLIKAWKWSKNDHTICILPLHHVHGIINIVGCGLWAGACCEFLPNFSAEAVFNTFKEGKINVFMAVPTIYFKLISHWESLPPDEQTELTETMSRFRLMVSGSAALPVSVMEKWKIISKLTLLERYGMTEIGMVLSNPYAGIRYSGHVGYPLPGVQVRLADEQDHEISYTEIGEIQVKGTTVFNEYWQKPEATAESFTKDGWFKTGDVATVDEAGGYRILGRNSVDIIKSGGYKISALEIEEVLRTHNSVLDCCVVGIDDNEWGELVVAAIVPKNEQIDLTELNNWIRTQMPAYKTPRKYKLINELPRNAMGKVTKNDVKKQLFGNIS
ncbi:acyl-CoA synthetase [Emticicia sp.]|uniref:acyl-CoA synthetase n=1 Tax=Emticicia sp. TaxID=1930953 RepID=UPI0037520A05